MVVVLIIAVLIAIGIPTFLGFTARARNAAAQTTLETAEKVSKLVELDLGTFPANATLLPLLPTLEASITWLDHMDSSTGPEEVSIDSDGATKLALATQSGSGACYYMRVELHSKSARMVDPVAATCVAHDYLAGPDTGW